MTTEQETPQPVEVREAVEIREFAQYARRNTPAFLWADTPPPGWPYGHELWREIQTLARRHFEEKVAYDFLTDLVERGYALDELGSGRMRRGAEVSALDGSVTRPQPSSTTAAEALEAHQVLAELAAAHLRIDPVLQGNLEAAAQGRWGGGSKQLAANIAAARGELAAWQAERNRAQEAEEAKLLLTVRHPFHAMGGKNYSPGEYRITPAEGTDLQTWQAKKEGMAKLRGWEAPDGFTPTSWPPFELNIQPRS